jgi:hypothetical protein
VRIAVALPRQPRRQRQNQQQFRELRRLQLEPAWQLQPALCALALRPERQHAQQHQHIQRVEQLVEAQPHARRNRRQHNRARRAHRQPHHLPTKHRRRPLVGRAVERRQPHADQQQRRQQQGQVYLTQAQPFR